MPNPDYIAPEVKLTISRLIRDAFLEIRMLGREGRATQAADLADAFHNVPTALSEERLDLDMLRASFVEYEEKHPGRTRFRYSRALDTARSLDR